MPFPPHKRPSALKEPIFSKQPFSSSIPQWGKMKLAWRISRLEMQDPFGWHEVDEEALGEIRNKLKWFESMTVNQVFVESKHINHSVPRDKLCSEARKRLGELRLDDVDELHSLHLSGTKRVWGILTENILTLLWWDPDHEVCPSYKKHT
jgi:hypothetical protein